MASGRKLRTGRTLYLGNHSPGNSKHYFGGEIYNVNMYSRELLSAVVVTISALGLCGKIPEHLEQYRSLKWEDILKLNRTGTVQDIVDPACAPLVELQAKLLKVEESYNSTRKELVEVRRELSRSEVVLNETQAELEVTKELS